MEDSSRDFGFETVLWVHVTNKPRGWYQGVLKAAERFNWYEKEAKKRTRRHASAMEGVQGKRDGGGGATAGNPRCKKQGRRWQTV